MFIVLSSLMQLWGVTSHNCMERNQTQPQVPFQRMRCSMPAPNCVISSSFIPSNILIKSITATTCATKINHALNEGAARPDGYDSMKMEAHI